MPKAYAQKLVQLLSISLLIISSLVFAADEDWKKVGSGLVRATSEIIIIPVMPFYQAQPFQMMRFHARNGDIKIRYAKLILDDGESVRLNIQKKILSGHNSRAIPLKIKGRNINKVVVYYLVEGSEQTRLEVMAQ